MKILYTILFVLFASSVIAEEYVYCSDLDSIQRLSDIERRIMEDEILHPPHRNYIALLLPNCGIRYFHDLILMELIREWDSIDQGVIFKRQAYRAVHTVDGLFNFETFVIINLEN